VRSDAKIFAVGVVAWLALAASAGSGHAGVTVTQNHSITNWSSGALIATVADPPGLNATVNEANLGTTNASQTFTATTNLVLTNLQLYVSGTAQTFNLRLYDLGTGYAANSGNPSPYTPGSDLFSGLSLAFTSSSSGFVINLAFTGADQVSLTNGHKYAFELGKVSGGPMIWYRTGSDLYANGDAYRDRSLINGTLRDFALAVYGTPFAGASITNGQCAVDGSQVYQRIDGFGGGVVFLDSGLDPVTDANMNTLYGTNNANQLGLSLLRVRIDPATNWGNALLDAQKAVARGAGVLATPWTPPASMKDNGGLTNGSLLPAQYATYASYLKNFAGYMSSNSASLRAISIQNEPDWPATYESCVWSSNQFLAFFRTNAGAFSSTAVMMPESLRYDQSISDATLDDPVAVTNINIMGGHLYGNGDAGVTIVDYPKAHNKGKPTWMTEFLVNDQTIGTAITTAKQVHDCLTTGNMSAYIWWKCLGDANGLVNASGVPQKRGFVMAQFSRFVRPGYYRIGASNNISTVAISGYKNTNSAAFAIVAINTGNTDINQIFNLTNFNALSVIPWITSGTQSLAVQSAVNVTNSSFSYTLPALSVVTFTGQAAANTPPTLAPVGDQVINPGISLVVTNTATDTNQPVQTLTFSLLGAPTNATLATLDNTHAVFSWRPLVSQASTTNPVSVKVADSGTPGLSATNNFKVIVNPLAQPTVSSITVSGGQVSLVATGAVGPDYTVLFSTNLTSWQALFTSNSPMTPVILVDTNNPGASPVRFYRIQLGP
jgi:glucuronoarabinoxylan endo-1,4-beta-xylanase